MLGITTVVLTADSDSHAAAFGAGDISIEAPRFSQPEYIPSILESIDRWDVGLLLSANDYDISLLSKADLTSSRAVVAVPPIQTLDITEDKYATVKALTAIGLSAPRTLLGGEVLRYGSHRKWSVIDYVVKHRYGSGSSGVFVVPEHLLEPALKLSVETAPDISGLVPAVPDVDLVVVQEKIEGVEHGLDVVCDFHGRFQAVLAREKIRMRSGETDQARTVDPVPFEALGRRMSQRLSLVGTTDVDVIVRPDGQVVVLDINARFGGGYPFSHIAGANIPACYVAWSLNQDIDRTWLRPEVGVRGSKYTALLRTTS
jgi:carbamoyl-phosphate synthase large subunit